MMEIKMKHLEMIENVIQRMGSNSFQLKGWSVSLVAIIGGLAAQGSDKRFFLLAFIPLIAFWFLDSYYLQLERKYEVLYSNVAAITDDNSIDFNMDLSKAVYVGDDADRVCFCRCLFSKTEWPFYLIITGAVAILAIILIIH